MFTFPPVYGWMDGVYGRKTWHGLGNQNYWDTYYMQGHAFMIHNFEKDKPSHLKRS
jgi:hypothetical protein